MQPPQSAAIAFLKDMVLDSANFWPVSTSSRRDLQVQILIFIPLEAAKYRPNSLRNEAERKGRSCICLFMCADLELRHRVFLIALYFVV